MDKLSKARHKLLMVQMGKLTAYLRLGKTEEAKAWAKILTAHLKFLGLIE